MRTPLTVLFLCTGNSCRSQMAQGWTQHLKGDTITAYSAGIETHGLNVHAVRVMAEVGVDISAQQSEHIDMYKDRRLDALITVCGHAHETCPYIPGEHVLVHAGFDDPPALAREVAARGGSEQEQLACYRRVRDEIRAFVETLPESLNLP